MTRSTRTLLVVLGFSAAACGEVIYWGDLRSKDGGADGATGGPGGSAGEGTDDAGGASTGGASTGGLNAGIPAGPCRGVTPEVTNALCVSSIDLSLGAIATDTLVLLDGSAAMLEYLPGGSVSRWDGASMGLLDFIDENLGKAEDATLGLSVFGGMPEGSEQAECDSEDYATPVLELTNDRYMVQTVKAALSAALPRADQTMRPMLPALQGALSYMKAKLAEDPFRTGRVVLVSAGLPSACQDPISVEQIAEAASAALASEPRVWTFVVQLGGDFDLSAIAEAGSREDPFVIGSGHVGPELYNILHSLYFTTIGGCDLDLSDSAEQGLLENRTLSLITHFGPQERAEVKYRYGGERECDSTLGGWYYDDPWDPKAIKLCPCSCAAAKEAEWLQVLLCYKAL